MPEYMVIHCLNQRASAATHVCEVLFLKGTAKNSYAHSEESSCGSEVLQIGSWKCGVGPHFEELLEKEDVPIVYVNEYPVLVSLKIPSSESDAMLRLLYNRNISRATLMPNLDNVAGDRSYVKKLFGD